MFKILVFSVSLLLFLLLSMSDVGFAQPCQVDQDCRGGRCLQGLCDGNPCTTDSHCGEREICINRYPRRKNECKPVECKDNSHCRKFGSQGVCKVTGTGSSRNYVCECRSDTYCGNEVCINGACKQCRNDSNCQSGVCINNSCKQCRDDSQCRADARCENYACKNICPSGKVWVTTMTQPVRFLCADAMAINLSGCSRSGEGCSVGKQCAKSVEGKYYCIPSEGSTPTLQKQVDQSQKKFKFKSPKFKEPPLQLDPGTTPQPKSTR